MMLGGTAVPDCNGVLGSVTAEWTGAPASEQRQASITGNARPRRNRWSAEGGEGCGLTAHGCVLDASGRVVGLQDGHRPAGAGVATAGGDAEVVDQAAGVAVQAAARVVGGGAGPISSMA